MTWNRRHWSWIAGLLLAGYLALFGFHSIVQLQRFSPDSMNYVDVARHLAAGDGVVQSTLGYNQPFFAVDGAIPSPMISQPPGYPMAIAWMVRSGLSAPTSALIIAWIGYAACLLLAFLLARRVFDQEVGWACLALLTLYHPLSWVSSWAWSESLACAMALASLLAFSHRRWTVAGLMAGAAFAVRYAMAPLPAVLLLTLAATRTDGRWFRASLRCALGAFVPVAAVLAHNLRVRGELFEPALPSTDSLGALLTDLWRSTLRLHLDLFSRDTEIGLFLLGLALSLGALARSRGLRDWGRSFTQDPARASLIVWVASYLALLLAMKLRVDFDRVDGRLIAPAGIVILMIWAAQGVMASGWLRRHARGLACVILLVAVSQQTWAALTFRAPAIGEPGRSAWIDEHTGPEDLVVGNALERVAFELGPRRLVSVSPYPSSLQLDHEMLLSIAEARRPGVSRSLLVLRRDFESREAWERTYGPFVAELMIEGATAYPRLVPLASGPRFRAWQVRARD